jgi:predicted ATPase/class 3 adenylate cyclase/Tfp pilus assembly protein PilF
MFEQRALLLTDLVDSTQLATSLGDVAAAGLSAAHDRVARDLLRRWHGREIDKTDGMLMLFEHAADAAGYAMAYHAALRALPVPLKARAGLHVGPVILRANAHEDVARGAKPLEVEGIAKPVAARIMSLASGGQTLLSAEARAALGPTALHVQSHGHWRIKGITEPVELFEIGDDQAPFTPPPDSAKVYRVVRQGALWQPLRQVRHNLPAERDAFVGREEVLVDLARRFDAGARLVSLLGIGGTGKTRLALRFARTWLGDYPGGAWFCDLSAARNLDGLLRAVAQGLDVPLGRDDPVLQLGHAIAGRGRCLVILDNFEQIARHAEESLGRWLDRAVEARFLVTTREVLGLPGEATLALAPLELGDAVALFMHRAAAARHDFHADAGEQAVVAKLVKLLDRLPLAIELAAARVRVLSPSALLARMGQRFKLMAALGGRQDRQSTLRATFDWSWELLSDAEKSALAQLSVFAGGFTLASAEAVLDLSACVDPPWVVDVLQSLVDKSLVRPLADARFDLLSSVQDYAAEQLRRDDQFPGSGGRACDLAERAHCQYFAALDAKAATARGCVETDNLVAACRRALRMGDAALSAATLENAWAALDLRGPFRIGLELAQAGLALAASGHERARMRLVALHAARACGQQALHRQHAELGLAEARQSNDLVVQAHVHCHLSELAADAGQVEAARTHHEQALVIARRAGDALLLCTVLNGVANFLMDHGSLEDARPRYLEALQVARQAGLARWEVGALGNLGNLDMELGRPAEARANFQAALDVAHRLGDLKFAGNQLSNLGLLDHVGGRAQQARSQFEAALTIARDIGHRKLECIVLCNLGIHFDGLGKGEDALQHFEQAIAVARELRDRRSEGQFLGYLGLAHARARRFDEARRCLAAGDALLQEVADPVSQALLLCARAEVEHLCGQAEAAAQYVMQARSISLACGAGPESELGQAIGRIDAQLAGNGGSADPVAAPAAGAA